MRVVIVRGFNASSKREEREKTHTHGSLFRVSKGSLSLSLSLFFFVSLSLSSFFFFFLFLFLFSFPIFFLGEKNCPFSLSLSHIYIYIYTHTRLDLGGEKGGVAFAREDGVVRDFFKKPLIYIKTYLIYIYTQYIYNEIIIKKKKKKKRKSDLGVFGMGVMGQNLALNVASKNFSVSCYNRKDEFSDRLFEALEIAKNESIVLETT